MNNGASDCWRIMPATVAQPYQRLLNNSELLNNHASDCSRIIPATVQELCQWLLKNCSSDGWRIVPKAVEQLCQLFFVSFIGKILTSFLCKYFNYYYFNSGSQLSKLQVCWLIITSYFRYTRFTNLCNLSNT